MDYLRVFVAIDVEDPLLVSRLERLKESILSTGVPMKPVEPYNYHITIRFIGETPRRVVDEIVKQLKTLSFKPFRATLRGLGAFPSISSPRVVWVGVSEGERELRELRDSVDSLLRRLGIPAEREEFKAHVTLARIKGSRNMSSLVKLLADLSDYEIGSMEVRSLRLKKSMLTREGPIYETIAEVKSL
ncbi:MAG: RNA 2',3'-cyclic phosphodiesterase [Acidilobaceae archaeon]